MPNTKIQRAEVENAARWLKQNTHVRKRAIAKCDLGGQPFGTALVLRPELYLELVNNVYREARAARAPKDVLRILSTQVTMIRSGLENLPKLAYTWMVITQLREVDNRSKRKAQSILRSAILRAPDAKNRTALRAMLTSALNHHDLPSGKGRKSQPTRALRRPGGGGVLFDPGACFFCCVLGCEFCGPFCLICCFISCIICGIL
jgi:hypothetical protein